MKTICLYLDEDAMDRVFVRQLRGRGIDVTTPEEEGTRGLLDVEQLAFATAQGRVIYTYNIPDFCRLHADYIKHGKHHAGIIVCQQQRYNIGEQVRRLLSLIAAKSAEEMGDTLEFLSAWETEKLYV
jgi:hypothetical protein